MLITWLKSLLGIKPQVFTLPPTEPDVDPVDPVKEAVAYRAIMKEITDKYGPLTEGWRVVEGEGGYIYRQYADGRLSIEEKGKPQETVKFNWTKFALMTTPLVLISSVAIYLIKTAPPAVATNPKRKKNKKSKRTKRPA